MKKRIIYLLIALLPILFLAIYMDSVFNEIKQNNVEMNLQTEEAQVRKLEARFVERFANSEQDTIILATYLAQNLSENETLLTINTQVVQDISGDILPDLLNYNSLYQEISFLDREGWEILSVNKENLNTLERKDPVNRSNKDYFLNVLEHRAGEVHVSFDGKYLRISSPIYDDNQFRGAVVFTLEKESFLKELQTESSDKVMLVEDTGKYIMTSGSTPSGDFITDYDPKFLEEMKRTSSGHLETEQGTLLTYIPLLLDDHQWFLMTQVKKEDLTAKTSALQNQLLKILLLTFGMILGLLGLWSLSYGKALKAKQLSKENTELTNLNNLLQQKQTELEKQAAIVEELNAQLEDENGRFLKQKDILHAIIDSLGTGLVMVDTSRKTVFFNNRLDKLITSDLAKSHFQTFIENNLAVDDLVQKIIKGAVNAQQIEAELKELDYTSNEFYTAELEYEQPQHRYFRISSYPCRASDGQALGRILLFRDITRFKEIDKLKSELISTVSHELRTPMSSIMGFSELLLTRELSPERTKQYIQVINEQAERLTRLINDFLDIQRMENGKQVFEKQKVDFRQVLNQVLELFKKPDETQQIFLQVDLNDSLYVLGDQDKLLQVMSNLLSNAIKYSPQSGLISITATVQAGTLQIDVTDHGLGIPKEALPQLFSKFFRVDNDDRRKIGGTGLGLAICKEIIEAHNGKIWAESTYGEGTTFKFTLPLMEPLESVAGGLVRSEVDEVEATMLMHGGESADEHVLDILRHNGIEVKELKRKDSILMITLEGEN